MEEIRDCTVRVLLDNTQRVYHSFIRRQPSHGFAKGRNRREAFENLYAGKDGLTGAGKDGSGILGSRIGRAIFPYCSTREPDSSSPFASRGRGNCGLFPLSFIDVLKTGADGGCREEACEAGNKSSGCRWICQAMTKRTSSILMSPPAQMIAPGRTGAKAL